MKNNLYYFDKKEFTCKCGCKENRMDKDFLLKLDKARFLSDTPYIITSGFRCKEHNLKVGGIPNSAHLVGLAVDIKVTNKHQLYQVLSGLFKVGFKRIIYYPNNSFIHVDEDLTKPYPVFTIHKRKQDV